MNLGEEPNVATFTEDQTDREMLGQDPQEWPEGDTFPLNSKCFTLWRLKQIGEGLGISPSATHSQLKLMIEGKLMEMGHDPSNVQVILSDGDESGITICLVDDEGVIK